MRFFLITGGGAPIVASADDVDEVAAERESAGDTVAITILPRGPVTFPDWKDS